MHRAFFRINRRARSMLLAAEISPSAFAISPARSGGLIRRVRWTLPTSAPSCDRAAVRTGSHRGGDADAAGDQDSVRDHDSDGDRRPLVTIGAALLAAAGGGCCSTSRVSLSLLRLAVEPPARLQLALWIDCWIRHRRSSTLHRRRYQNRNDAVTQIRAALV
jgi:hypothetical protein